MKPFIPLYRKGDRIVRRENKRLGYKREIADVISYNVAAGVVMAKNDDDVDCLYNVKDISLYFRAGQQHTIYLNQTDKSKISVIVLDVEKHIAGNKHYNLIRFANAKTGKFIGAMHEATFTAARQSTKLMAKIKH